jgi:hypothetical protein
MTGSDNKRLLAAMEANWQAEMEGHYTYTAFAKGEVDPQRRNALRVWPLRRNITPICGPGVSRSWAHQHPVRRRSVGSGRLIGKSSGRG